MFIDRTSPKIGQKIYSAYLIVTWNGMIKNLQPQTSAYTFIP